jgi:hypothetical protein
MLDLSNHALSITYLILWAAVFGRQICLPVPENLFLLTKEGLPVTLQLTTSEEAAGRFGIEIIRGEPRVTV